MITSHKFATISYRYLADCINEACEWLSDHGLVYPRTRIGDYQRHLNEMATYWEQGRITELLKLRNFQTLVNSTYEANELFYIFRGLSAYSDKSVTRKLKEFIKGPTSWTTENASSSNKARNIAFELHMAARFAAGGFQIDLTSEADLIVKVLGQEIFVECKRPQLAHQVNSNLKGALRQLVRRYPNAKEPDLARGIVAISIGKVFNPKQLLISGSTVQALSQRLGAINSAFIDHHEQKWRNAAEKRTIGVLVHIGCPAEIKGEKLLTHCHEFALKTTFTNDSGLEILRNIQEGFMSCNWG